MLPKLNSRFALEHRYAAIKRHVPKMKQIGGFPVTNRGAPLSFDHVRSIFLQPHDRFLELVQDVNALLFLCRYRKFFEISMNEIKILCSAVRGVRARSARISIISLFHASIISLKLQECHLLTHKRKKIT